MTTLQFYALQKHYPIFPYYHTSLQVPKVSGTHIAPALVPASTLLLSVTAGNYKYNTVVTLSGIMFIPSFVKSSSLFQRSIGCESAYVQVHTSTQHVGLINLPFFFDRRKVS